MSARQIIEAASGYPGYPDLVTLGLSHEQIRNLVTIKRRVVDEERNPRHQSNAMEPKWIVTELIDAELDGKPIKFMLRRQTG